MAALTCCSTSLLTPVVTLLIERVGYHVILVIAYIALFSDYPRLRDAPVSQTLLLELSDVRRFFWCRLLGPPGLDHHLFSEECRTLVRF
ncbi:hypothetical protein CY34DRAFT_797300 [Suillus luteus UH-Slu-Lm8-n1]|uniref:Uncharacterized protein n=1 Tax=Suillus luteus UH-Slu-Lm8-n1 TaxID=930992 RepID=A0A0D0BIF8_9AGAM|nr:hypothetical protein CY34DRAFT_797300 [Suillus luteus UH-Slu-Lm8-n1]